MRGRSLVILSAASVALAAAYLATAGEEEKATDAEAAMGEAIPAEYAEKAASALRFTSRDLFGFGVVDDIIEEPLGGAHRDHQQMALRLKTYLNKALRDLTNTELDQLLQDRYEKFRRMGVFLEQKAPVMSADE